ncbi:MAG: prepilin-type N-terminal cleavage/methylation domain-containing protein [Deltaproteobacteria bacterium]|nr:prepilin-type N-terminal cleavage/methylation domain-containing protein [Deltaproteobacteria bacterium]NND27944.1 prepilin-type N-terminal cleavage/methylation domain-containing protein [Myxococcales bacterium]MBT8463103.1 prepilin-type N-terminal cleavage/methylation domain-containing protein [Deltaproteobacteria bacterium]MBT8482845.1 prepilin-type N-terminal cleavage/methylation domain-containing protein [Deltaproteobacteria bacterium]NNK08064.1 prepilin-type N-terminal cleavage/methylati
MVGRVPPRTSRGFTLIEVIVVIAIIAVVVTGATFGLGAITRTRLRSSAFKVMSAARFAYNRSLTQGTTTRLRFDFDKDTMAIEETLTPVTLATTEQLEDEDGQAVDPWDLARARLEQPLTPIKPTSPFQPIANKNGKVIERYTAKPVGEAVSVHALITPHETETRTDGEGSVYFFPGGLTEHAVIQLSDASDTVYSIEIHPLTGNARIHNFAYEPLDELDDEGEVEDSL